MMAPLDTISPPLVPQRDAQFKNGVVRDIAFLAEHYLRNCRPSESFALLYFLDEVAIPDRRLKKMLLVAAVEVRRLDVAKRLLTELGVSETPLSEEEARILEYYLQKVTALGEAA